MTLSRLSAMLITILDLKQISRQKPDQCLIVLTCLLVSSRFLDSVPVEAVEYFRASAEKLIEERGAVEALAAALAHISGAKTLEQRSLLNSDAVSLRVQHTTHRFVQGRDRITHAPV